MKETCVWILFRFLNRKSERTLLYLFIYRKLKMLKDIIYRRKAEAPDAAIIDCEQVNTDWAHDSESPWILATSLLTKNNLRDLQPVVFKFSR